MQRVRLRSLVRKLGSQMPGGNNNQNITRKTIIKNSIKALRMVHIKKNLKEILRIELPDDSGIPVPDLCLGKAQLEETGT